MDGPESPTFLLDCSDLAYNAAVLDIRFGCEAYYPESYAPTPCIDLCGHVSGCVPARRITADRIGRR